jgi:hypothetical protein
MNWVKNLYYSGDQGQQSKHNAYMHDKCIRDYDNSVFRETKHGAMTNYNDDVSNASKPTYNRYKNLVCTGPYWNNSKNASKLGLKFVSKEYRDYLKNKSEYKGPNLADFQALDKIIGETINARIGGSRRRRSGSRKKRKQTRRRLN